MKDILRGICALLVIVVYVFVALPIILRNLEVYRKVFKKGIALLEESVIRQ